MIKKINCFFVLFLLTFNGYAIPKTLYLKDYGILEPHTSIERYEILRSFYNDVQKYNANASYKGVDEILIELPSNVQPILLPEVNDFSNVIIKVLNKQKDVYLFELKSPTTSVTVRLEELNKGIFQSPKLERGHFLMVLNEANLWTKRGGFDEYIHRHEVLLVKDGIAQNRTISSYASSISSIKGSFAEISDKKKCVTNLIFERDPLSQHKTGLIRISNQYNIEINNIRLKTPSDSSLYEDKAIQINSSAKVTLKNITINGTYSKKDKWGYGINLNNVFDVTVKNIKAEAEWGVLGCVYINNAKISDCEMNRFDLHCYGRDFSFKDCTFRNSISMPYSSFYGRMNFENCKFADAEPLHFRQEYNANTPHEIIFKKCIFRLTPKYNGIIRMNRIKSHESGRDELKDNYLPNIKMRDCNVYVPKDVKCWHLAIVGNDSGSPVKGLNTIYIDGLKIHCSQNTKFDPLSEPIETNDSLTINIKNTICITEGNISKPLVISEAILGSKVSLICNGSRVRKKEKFLKCNILTEQLSLVSCSLMIGAFCFLGYRLYEFIKDNNL